MSYVTGHVRPGFDRSMNMWNLICEFEHVNCTLAVFEDGDGMLEYEVSHMGQHIGWFNSEAAAIAAASEYLDGAWTARLLVLMWKKTPYGDRPVRYYVEKIYPSAAEAEVAEAEAWADAESAMREKTGQSIEEYWPD